MQINNEIWILNDNRPGNFSQMLGLAQELKKNTGYNYKIIDLTYNFLIKFPNFFLKNSLWHLSKESQQKIKEFKEVPKLIISAGRRSASIALYLKNKSQNHCKIAQIMDPNLNLKKFDFVILPQHDKNNSNLENDNIIRTLGALNKINDDIIQDNKKEFSNLFQNIDKPKIALLVGGSSKKNKFDNDSALKLATICSDITNNMDAKLLILNSRRTSDQITKILKDNLKCDFDFFNWHDSKENNPYLAILGYANYFIITGDSVSMISECCATAKPTYIFNEKQISTPKHLKFHDSLYKDNYAKKLTSHLKILDNFSPKKLQETQKIANLIKNKF